jgi:hypothetical protein
MPNALTHKYISDQIFDSLDEKTKAIIKKHRKLYTLGCLGPDVLMGLVFYNEPKIRDAGESLHTSAVYAGLCNTANYLAENRGDEKLYAYYIGTLTHYAADSTIHPYVYHYVENRLKQRYDDHLSSCLHTIVETEMDAYIGITLLNGKHADTFWQFSGSKKLRRIVRKYYLDINRKIFKLALNRADIRQSIFFFKLLMFVTQRHNNGMLRFYMVQKIDRMLKADHLLMSALRPRNLDDRYDYLNLEASPYRAVYKEKFCPLVSYTFPEMLEISKIRGLEYIKKANEHIFEGHILDLRDFELNYNGSFNTEYLEAVEDGIVEARETTTLKEMKDKLPKKEYKLPEDEDYVVTDDNL